MSVFTNYLEKLGSNFLVSAMVPSLALIVASILVFDPIIQVTNLFTQNNAYQLVGFGLLLFILTVIIGFTLTALNTYILKIFEGYAFFHRLPPIYKLMLKAKLNKARDLSFQRDFYKRRISILENSFTQTDRTKRKIKDFRSKYYSTASHYDQSYPQKINEILPTEFGNILKASEQYTNTRYGFDGVTFWPRILQVVPASYQINIEETRNELSFLVNMSVLAVLFFIFSVIAIFYTLAHPPTGLTGSDLLLQVFLNAAGYGIAGFISLTVNQFFYKASIYSVRSFGAMIRSTYDLFRLDLLKQFKLKMPKDSIEEWDAWKNLNEFIVLGRHSLTFQKIVYDTKQRTVTKLSTGNEK